MARKQPSIPNTTEVLTRSRRKCCICFALNDDLQPKRGQIAHLDGDHANSASENLAWMCLPHHDEYDSRTSQSKGMTIHEAKYYRGLLYDRMESDKHRKHDNDIESINRIVVRYEEVLAIREASIADLRSQIAAAEAEQRVANERVARLIRQIATPLSRDAPYSNAADEVTEKWEWSVLLAEPHGGTGELLKRLLQERGMRITYVGDFLGGFRALVPGAHFDLFVSEVSVASQQEWAIMSIVRGMNIPALAVSSFDLPGSEELIRAHGFGGHLRKPFNFGELLAEMRRLVGRIESTAPNARDSTLPSSAECAAIVSPPDPATAT